MQLREGRYGDALTAPLIREIQQEMTDRYGGPDETPVAADQFAAPSGTFLVAHVDGEPVGCAGLRGRTEAEVELKRMYIRPTEGFGHYADAPGSRYYAKDL
jgi:hypothetical protein